MPIMSIEKIAALLRAQAQMRSQENDEAGVLLRLADELERDVASIEDDTANLDDDEMGINRPQN